MFKRILVPLDGSSESERAIPLAAAVASRYGAAVTLTEVVGSGAMVELEEVVFADSGVLPAEYSSQAVQEQGIDYLNSVAVDLRRGGLAQVEVVLCRGDTGSEIQRLAGDADLVVMATHGRSGLARLLLGSMAMNTVRQVTTPVLLVNGHLTELEATYSFKRLLVPLDRSRLAESALPLAVSVAQQLGAELVLLELEPQGIEASVYIAHHVGQNGASEDEVYLLGPDAEVLPAYIYLEDIADRYLPVDLHYTLVAGEGQSANHISQVAQERGCDLIVMATHGQAGINRLLHGSVTEQVLTSSPVPVLVLHSTSGVAAASTASPQKLVPLPLAAGSNLCSSTSLCQWTDRRLVSERWGWQCYSLVGSIAP